MNVFPVARVALLFFFVSSLLCCSACSTGGSETSNCFEVNKAGLSYGTDLDVASAVERYIEREGQPYSDEEMERLSEECYPDLIAVEASNGKVGYVYWDQLYSVPSSPDEALQFNKMIRKEGIALEVYDAETMEVVGTYVIGGDNE